MVSAPAYYFKDPNTEWYLFRFFLVIILQHVVLKVDMLAIAYAGLSGDLKDNISTFFKSSLKKKFPYQQGKSVCI